VEDIFLTRRSHLPHLFTGLLPVPVV